MNIKSINKGVIIFILLGMIISACTKPNEEPPEESKDDKISGRKVRYTVMVVNPAYEGMESSVGIDSAIVSLVMNDSIYNVATDPNGIAKFNNLAAGIIAVRISHPQHATVNMVVDITTKNDSSEYDAENLRNASTMVGMFPVEGKNMATISGKALADLDLTASGLENAIEGLSISSYIAQNQLINYVNHTGDGKITSIVCRANTQNATTNKNGDYSIKVPASKDGLKVVIVSDDFVYSQKTISGEKRHVYKAVKDTLTVFSGIKHINDIKYN